MKLSIGYLHNSYLAENTGKGQMSWSQNQNDRKPLRNNYFVKIEHP
jgi:hypothetical protein